MNNMERAGRLRFKAIIAAVVAVMLGLTAFAGGASASDHGVSVDPPVDVTPDGVDHYRVYWVSYHETNRGKDVYHIICTNLAAERIRVRIGGALLSSTPRWPGSVENVWVDHSRNELSSIGGGQITVECVVPEASELTVVPGGGLDFG